MTATTLANALRPRHRASAGIEEPAGRLFCALREANGWIVAWVTENTSASPMDAAKAMLEATGGNASRRAIYRSGRLHRTHEKISKGAHLTKEERIIHERNHFERTVGVRLDEA